MSLYSRFGKRLSDIVLAGGALVLLSPLLVLAAVAVRLDSPGPALFLQPRVGRGQRLFTLLKFRTMIDRRAAAIDQAREQAVASGVDSRITRLGRLFRRTSIDELPQLINILRGDMSLVGPRPVIPEQLEAMGPADLGRFAARPGLTGLAQVVGRRGLAWPEQLRLDVEYCRAITFRGDLVIILKTFKVLFSGAGVYGTAADNWRNYRNTRSG